MLDKVIATCRTDIPQSYIDAFIENFDYLYNIMIEKGHIPEEVWNTLDIFPKDQDANGNEVSRDATISQESRQRAKSLTHQYQVDLRQKHFEDIQNERKRIEDGKRVKKLNQIRTARELRERLQSVLRHRNAEDEEDFSNLSIEDVFLSLKAPEMVEFILAHDPNINKKSQLKQLCKGKLKENMDAVENDLSQEEFNTTTLVAYRCRNMDCKFDLSESLSDSREDEIEPEDQNASATEALIVELTLENRLDAAVLPSELLSSLTWVGVACELFRVNETVQNPIVRVNEEMKQKADLLVKLLRSRLNAFMRKRRASKNCQNHWAIALAIKNLSTVAAHMVLSDHVKDNLNCLDESHSLLTSEFSRYPTSSTHNKDIGAYLYFDTNHCTPVRSGSVYAVDKGFGGRHGDHFKAAKDPTVQSSNFYNGYPTKCNVRAQSNLIRGHFESLTMVTVAGFDPKSDVAKVVDKDFTEGGLLVLNESDKTKMKECMKRDPDVVHKFQTFVAYLMEFGYDLAIAPASNVSDSFGFEAIVGLM